jgi:hypothetical protein
MMTFAEVLKRLNIEDYAERIWHSNSHGELMHLHDYAVIADCFQDLTWFREWFVAVVAEAEKKWKRPESVFQHIGRILLESVEGQDDGSYLKVSKTGSYFLAASDTIP